MFTGEFYRFYSDKNIDKVFLSFKNKISTISYSSQDQFGSHASEHVLFCYKDNKMLECHSENGYNLDIDGQGCFCIEAKTVKLHGSASLFKFDESVNFDPYRIDLLLDNIFYYFLILPDLIEESVFCKEVHKLFVRSIKEA